MFALCLHLKYSVSSLCKDYCPKHQSPLRSAVNSAQRNNVWLAIAELHDSLISSWNVVQHPSGCLFKPLMQLQNTEWKSRIGTDSKQNLTVCFTFCLLKQTVETFDLTFGQMIHVISFILAHSRTWFSDSVHSQTPELQRGALLCCIFVSLLGNKPLYSY